MQVDSLPPGSDTSFHPYTPPTPAVARAVTRAWAGWFDPTSHGPEDEDFSRPALWVGNHARYGVLDTPVMIGHFYTRHGVWLRGLADNIHFRVPPVRRLVLWGGGVPANHAAAGRLMAQGAHVLVYPGGAREVTRRRGEDYQLIWKDHCGFAKLAIAHGYDIMPFGAVGPDEAYRPLLDLSDLRHTALWRRFNGAAGLDAQTRGGDLLPPLPLGLGGTLLPRPQRFLFGFGPRIRTDHLRGQADDHDSVWAIREQVRRAVEGQLANMQQRRDAERPSWPAWRRWLTR